MFGTDESIFGYKNLRINAYFAAGSLDVHLDLQHSAATANAPAVLDTIALSLAADCGTTMLTQLQYPPSKTLWTWLRNRSCCSRQWGRKLTSTALATTITKSTRWLFTHLLFTIIIRGVLFKTQIIAEYSNMNYCLL